jgi:hypothetical protein
MKRLIERLRTLLGMAGRGLVYMICLSITVFIIASSYETASNQDVPVLDAIQKVSLDSLAPTLQKQSIPALSDKERQGTFGQPETMRVSIDGKPIKVLVAPALRNDGHWLARANTSHVLYTTEAKTGNAGDMLIYMKQSWRTIADPSQIAKDGNIFIDTDQNWRYMFRVQSVQTAPRGTTMLLPESRTTQLTIIIDAPNGGSSVIVRGQFMSLVNIGQV